MQKCWNVDTGKKSTINFILLSPSIVFAFHFSEGYFRIIHAFMPRHSTKYCQCSSLSLFLPSHPNCIILQTLQTHSHHTIIIVVVEIEGYIANLKTNNFSLSFSHFFLSLFHDKFSLRVLRSRETMSLQHGAV